MAKQGHVTAQIIKADAPLQINADEKRFATDWTEPEMDLDALGVMVDNSGILPQCIRAYKNNIAGYGIGIKYINDDQEDNPDAEAEWKRLEDIINLLTIEEDTKEVFEDIIESRERYGVSYCEVIRNHKGEVVQLDFIKETSSVRKTRPLEYAPQTYFYKGKSYTRQKRFRKYKQTIGGTTVYFKEFGDPRIMDTRSGEFVDKLETQYQANEIIEFAVGPDNYGKVRWIGQILGCDGARRAENLNNNYFINGRHTPLMISVQGGSLTDKSRALLKEYINGIKGEAGQHSFLLLETESTDNDFDAKQPTIEIKDLASILQKDELFQDYIENNRKRVQSAFNLPDLYVGYTQDFNRATAQTAMEVTEKQVFQPERASLAWAINNRLLNGYQLKYCEVEFKAPDITNPDDLYKILSITERAGGLTPNKAKQIAYESIGESPDDYEEEWGDIPLVIQNVLGAQAAREAQAEQFKTLYGNNGNTSESAQSQKEEPITPQGLKVSDMEKEQLNSQIEKAEREDAPAEVIAIMKEVRRLLTDIKEQGDENEV